MSAPHGDLTFAKLNPQAFHFSQKTSFVVIGLIATIDFRFVRHSGTIPRTALNNTVLESTSDRLLSLCHPNPVT
jgi:hypothetical protein